MGITYALEQWVPHGWRTVCRFDTFEEASGARKLANKHLDGKNLNGIMFRFTKVERMIEEEDLDLIKIIGEVGELK